MNKYIEEYKKTKQYYSAAANLLLLNSFGNIGITHDEVFEIWKKYDTSRNNLLDNVKMTFLQKILFKLFGIVP